MDVTTSASVLFNSSHGPNGTVFSTGDVPVTTSNIPLATTLPSNHTNSSTGGTQTLEEVSNYLWIVLSPIIFFVGMVGNTLNLAVLKRMRFWIKPSIFFLVPLSLTDMTVLCVGLIRYWTMYLFDFDLRVLSNAGCKVNLFVIYFSMQLSSWILVCITTERFIKTNFPLRYRTFVTIKKETVALCVIILVLVLVDGHLFFTNGLTVEQGSTESSCTSLTKETYYFDEHVFVYIDFAFLSVLPALIMIVMNVRIWHALRKSREFVRSASVGKASVTYQRFNVKLTRMLLFTSTYFVVATVPISMYFIVDTYVKGNNDYEISQKDLANTVTYVFQFTNYAANFFLYTLANTQFRAHLKSIVLRRNYSGRLGRSHQSSVNTVSSRLESSENSFTETEQTVTPNRIELDIPEQNGGELGVPDTRNVHEINLSFSDKHGDKTEEDKNASVT